MVPAMQNGAVVLLPSKAQTATAPRADDNVANPPNFSPDGFGSAHRDGFNALFADGSVRFLKYAMSTVSTPLPKYPQGCSVFQRVCDRCDFGSVSSADIE